MAVAPCDDGIDRFLAAQPQAVDGPPEARVEPQDRSHEFLGDLPRPVPPGDMERLVVNYGRQRCLRQELRMQRKQDQGTANPEADRVSDARMPPDRHMRQARSVGSVECRSDRSNTWGIP